jgi:TRAP-type C4-dicarboxylate transport system permease small subunit
MTVTSPMMKAYRLCYRVFRALGAAFVLALIVVILASIVLREVFSLPLVWANEVAICFFVWGVFIGAGVGMAENAHIRFSILIDRLPLAGRRVAGLAVSYLGLILLGGLLVTSAYLTWLSRDQRFTTIALSAAWQWAALPAGSFLALLGWLRHGKWTWNGPELHEKPLTDMPVL